MHCAGLAKTAAPSGLFARFKKPPPAPKGLYIHGEVGRGKTMVMDLFHAAVDVAPKRRVHFHAFMQEVHKRLHAARQSHTQDAIAPVAKAIAKEARLLCLDEMQITDIADAMIVGRLFEGLLAHGTVIVTTSNLKPDDLYRNGLNRQLFLPFIELIGERLDVVSLDSPTDYRLGRVKAHETFLTPISPETDARLQDLWQRLTDTERGEPHGHRRARPQAPRARKPPMAAPASPSPNSASSRWARRTTWRWPRIPASCFSSTSPPSPRTAATRPGASCSSSTRSMTARSGWSPPPRKLPEHIYPEGDHAFEFGRTVSRLKEMQSASWWGKKIVET